MHCTVDKSREMYTFLCADAEVISKNLFSVKHLLMTAMPLPGMTWPVWHEIGSSLVLHPLWEPQQDPYIIVGGLGAVGSATWRAHTLRDKNSCTS